MKRQIKMISLSLIILLMLQIILPVLINIEIDTSYALTMASYFKEADSFSIVGNDTNKFTNTSIQNSKYVVYSNALYTENGKQYDLVVYPFKRTADAIVQKLKKPTFEIHVGEAGYKLVITEHGRINSPVAMNVMLGFSDLDKNEYVTLPSGFSEIHKGEKITFSGLSEGKKYEGNVEANTEKEQFYSNCIIGNITVPTSGITIYYGAKGVRSTGIVFDAIKGYIEKNAYTIEFNANGGTGTPNSIIKFGTNTSTVIGDISSTVPTRSGYIFKGWSASSSWSSRRIAYSSEYGGSTARDGTTATTTGSSWTYDTYCSNTGGNSSNKTLTLYAQWETLSYSHTLAYNANGGSGAPSSSVATNTSSTHSMTISNTIPTRTGYTFGGWNTNASGTGSNYSAGGSISVGANATVTLYAKWTINTSTLKINPDGGSWEGSTAEQSFTQNYNTTKSIAIPSRTGYTFTGWTKVGTNGSLSSTTSVATYTYGAANNVTDTITAKWQKNNYNLQVRPNGGTWNNSTSNQDFTIDYQGTKSIALPIRNGYTFTGWTLEGTGSTISPLTEDDATFTMGTSNATLTANWEENSYNLVINPNGGVWDNSTNNQTFTIPYKKTKNIPLPTRENYVFMGWRLEGTGSTMSSLTEDNATFTMGDGNAILTADWDKVRYDLVINSNGGTWNNNEEEQTLRLAFEETKKITLPIRTGYTFTGWKLEGTETGSTMSSLTEDNAIFTMGIARATLTATWRINSYNLEVKPNGGLWKESAENQNITINYGKTEVIPVPSRNSYNFTKWILAGEGSQITSLDANNSNFTMGYADATLTAEWQLIMHNITGKITWNDQENKYTSRPSKVEVTLNSDEEVTEEGATETPTTKTITTETYEFKNLQTKKIEDNTDYIYTVKQNKILGYETIVNGYNITNNLVLPSYTSEVTITPQYNLESEFVKNEQVQIVGIVTASESNREKIGTCKDEANFAIDNGIEINRDSIKITYIDKEGNTKEINNFEVKDNIIKVGFESNREDDNTAGDSLKIEVKGTLKEIKQYTNTISYAGYLRDYETGEETNINLGTLTTASKNITVGKVSIGIKEINEENEITRDSEFKIRKKETGEVVQTFTTEGKEEIIRKLDPMVEYVVIETKPTAGYTTAEEVTFMINEQGEIVIKSGAEKEGNSIIIRDHKTQLQVEIKEEGTNQYVVGSRWQIIRKTEENGQMVEEIMIEWTSEGKEKQIEKLSIGEYILREVGIGENTGYVTIEDRAFRIEDTKGLQKLEVEQKISKVQIHIKDEDNKEYSAGSTWQLIDKEEQNVVREWITNGKVYEAQKLPLGEYILKEISIGENTGYVTNEEQEISIVDTREVQHFEVEQKISKVQIHIKDEDSKEYSTGSTWQLIDKEKQNVVKEWLANGEIYGAQRLPVGDYILKEITIGQNTGYVTNIEQEINIVDTREIQHFEIEQSISKVQIHIKDEDNKEYSTGSRWQLMDKAEGKVVREWLANGEVYGAQKLPVGTYILKEVSIGENTGYVTNEEQEINIVDSREVQHFEVEQNISKVQIHIKDEDNKEYSTGSTWQLIDKEEQKMVREWLANGEVYVTEKLPVGIYILKEVAIGENTGYVTNAEQEINIVDTREVQHFEVEQKISKVQIHIKDEDSKEYSTGSRWQLVEKTEGKVVREWTTNGEAYETEKLPVGTYTLKEVSIGENTGYVTNAEQEINIVDTREVQHFEIEQNISKVQIHIKDEDNKGYSTGSRWQLVEKTEGKVVREWTANGEAYGAEKLPVGTYIVKEVSIGENTGYVTNTEQEISIIDTREVQHFEVEQKISKIQIHIKDEDNKEYSTGSTWQLVDKAEGKVVREWTANEEAYRTEKLPVGTYTLKEISIGENTGYVTNADQEINIVDTREIQHFEVEQKISKVQIHIKDEDNKEYSTGSTWQLVNKAEEKVVREWTANGEVYRTEKLPVGTYTLKEISIGENTGYVTNAEQEISIVDTREIQEFEVEQRISKMQIHIKDEDNKEYSTGSTWQLVDKAEGKVVREWIANEEAYKTEKLPVGTYTLKEISIGENTGYVTNAEQEIRIIDTREVQEFEVEQKISKVQIHIKDEDNKEYSTGSTWQLVDKAEGKVVREWTTNGEVYVTEKVPVGTYTLKEISIGENTGYVTNADQEISIVDTRKVQEFEIEQKISKVQIHIKDEDNKEYSTGSTWQLIDKEKQKVVREWIANGEIYSTEKLPVGTYILKEVGIRENTGYVTNADQEINIVDTREVQHFEVEQKISKVQIHIKDEDSKEYSTGSTWQLIDKEKQKVVREWLANGEVYVTEKLPVGTYILKEVGIGENTGYVTNADQEISIADTREVQHFEVEQKISKVQIHIKDEDNKEYSTGSTWQLVDKTEGKVVREWTANGEAYKTEKLPVGTYTLKEISIGENTGYVTNVDQEIKIVDTREVQHFEVEQKISKVQIHIKNEDNKEYSTGSTWKLIDKAQGNVVREWTANGKIYSTEKVSVGTYILKEVGIGENTGYVTNADQEISIVDTREVQHFEVEQKISKVQIHIKDEDNKEYSTGSRWQLMDKADGNVVREWTANEEIYSTEKLPVGTYILKEVGIGENTGYVTNADQEISIVDTREMQHFEVEQKISKVQIHIKDEDSREYSTGSRWQLMDKADGNIVREWTANGEAYVTEKLPVGTYILKEVGIGENTGYVTNEEQEIEVVDTRDTQHFEVEQKISRIQIHIKEEDKEAYSTGSTWQLMDKADGNVVREWITEEAAYTTQKLPVGTYILKEISIGEHTGYVTNREEELEIIDTRDIQDFTVEEKISKVRIHLKDIETEAYVEGAILQIIRKTEENQEEILREWLAQQKGDLQLKLPVGDYTIREIKLPEHSAYITMEETSIKVIDILEEQQVELKQDVTKIRIEVADEETKEKIHNLEITILDKETKQIVATTKKQQENTIEIKEMEESYEIERLPIGKYILRETTPDGYRKVEDIEIKIEDTSKIQMVNIENQRLIYDMQVEKELISITMDGEKKHTTKGELQKVEVQSSKINTTDIKIEYIIRVSNVGETRATIGKIVDYIPDGLKLISTDWEQEGKQAIWNAEKEELEPSQSKEVRILLKWENNASNFGEKRNTAGLLGSTNPYEYEDNNIDNNLGEQITIFSIKTGSEEIAIVIKSISMILLGSVIICFIVGIKIAILKRKE